MSDLAHTFFNFEAGPFGPDPNASTAVVKFAPEGLVATVSGPPGSHHVNGTGQAIWPSDDIDSAGGAVGVLTGLWYLAWNQ